jgi:hypothetical protein
MPHWQKQSTPGIQKSPRTAAEQAAAAMTQQLAENPTG